jgi:hypothetical protein
MTKSSEIVWEFTRAEDLREENERLREALLCVAEWCDSVAKYEPNKGGQQCGMPTSIQQVAGSRPTVKTEFRHWARDIRSILEEP